VSSTVLVIGSRGFIGRHVRQALEAAGHRVRRADRPEVDFARPLEAAAWRERLAGVDVAVNTVGIFREQAGASFEAVHVRGPLALFQACADAGVRVIQLSALGADPSAPTPFLRTKFRADEALLALAVPSLVLQPSLVFGPGGRSASLFMRLAALPWIPLPGDGEQRVQPVRVDDVAQAVVRAVERDDFPRARVAVVGPVAMSLRELIGRIRASLGLRPARFVAVPRALVAWAAGLRMGLLDRDSLAMLERGSVADAARFAQLLGRDPAPVPGPLDATMRTRAQLAWLLPLLRVSLAAVWLTAGVVSFGLYPVSDSMALLARTGLTGPAASIALYGAATLDIVMGLATLFAPRRGLWLAQIGLIAAYTAIITIFLPEQWLHPYGPVVKNLPILAALAMLHQLDR
jgi:uncharacterized protein YbjT (DUF2867 family)/uncharacterized membrane protein YphA (DoxX/SURF4 family)